MDKREIRWTCGSGKLVQSKNKIQKLRFSPPNIFRTFKNYTLTPKIKILLQFSTFQNYIFDLNFSKNFKILTAKMTILSFKFWGFHSINLGFLGPTIYYIFTLLVGFFYILLIGSCEKELSIKKKKRKIKSQRVIEKQLSSKLGEKTLEFFRYTKPSL